MKIPAGPKLASAIINEYIDNPPPPETERFRGVCRETLGALQASPEVLARAPIMQAIAVHRISRMSGQICTVDAVRISYLGRADLVAVTGARRALPWEARLFLSSGVDMVEVPMREQMEASA